jgi:hypothetical protein
LRQRSSSSPLLESLQMFGLHETRRGSSYVPPAILVHLSQLHKKGTLCLPPRKAAPSAPAKDDGAKADAPKLDASKSPAPTPASPTPSPLPTKIFFAAAALALVISTCTGLFMSWKYARHKAVVGGMLLEGIDPPTALTVSMMAGNNLTSHCRRTPHLLRESTPRIENKAIGG